MNKYLKLCNDTSIVWLLPLSMLISNSPYLNWTLNEYWTLLFIRKIPQFTAWIYFTRNLRYVFSNEWKRAFIVIFLLLSFMFFGRRSSFHIVSLCCHWISMTLSFYCCARMNIRWQPWRNIHTSTIFWIAWEAKQNNNNK